MHLFQWLVRKTSYTFSIALVSVLGGQAATFYGYYYFQALSAMKTDAPIVQAWSSLLGPSLILLLAAVSSIHYGGFGVLRAVGLRWEMKSLRHVNDHLRAGEIRDNLPRERLSALLDSLSRFPILNTVAAGILGCGLFLCLLARVMLEHGSVTILAVGLQAGVVALFTYAYITYLITDFLTMPARSRVKKALHRAGGSFRDSYLFSLRGKFVCFFAFLLITLFVIHSFHALPGERMPDVKALTLFTALSVLISTFIVILYLASIHRSLEEARVASEELASGGEGYVFSGSLDREFIDLNRSMITLADEVNRYRHRMENLVRGKTEALERSLAELRDSEKRFRSMVENGSDVITILDAEGARLYISPSVERVLGHTVEELTGRTPFDQTHPEDLPRVKTAFEHVLGKPEETLRIRFRTRHRSGSWRTLETTGKNLLDDPAVGGLVITSRDITEAEQAAEEREKTLSLLRATLESTTDGILVVNREGKIESSNREFHRMWRIPEAWVQESRDDRLLESLLDQLKHPDAFLRKVRDLDDREDEESFDILEFKDGRTFERYSKPQKIGGRTVGRVWTFRDVTERRKAEAQLRAYQERLQELVDEKTLAIQQEILERRRAEQEVRKLNEELETRVKQRTEDLAKACEELKLLDAMKDTFLSSISHELRTPLTSIRSFSEILLHYADEDGATRQEFLGIILKETERLTRLINDFLDLSKIEAGKMIYNDGFVSLDEIIREGVRSLTQAIGERDLRMTVDIPEDIPPVFVDRDRIYQVLMNLTGNAIKFSPLGEEVRIRARVFPGKRTGEPAEWVRVSITDHGIGIEEGDFQMIFDKFSQVTTDTLQDKPQGTGLGLPISKEIVLNYGGNIWVESRKGHGSTFSFTLPTFVRPQASRESVPTSREQPTLSRDNEPACFTPALNRQAPYSHTS